MITMITMITIDAIHRILPYTRFAVVRIAVVHIRNNPYARFTVVRITDSYRVFLKLCPYLKQHYLSIVNICGQVKVH